jgi:sucrose-phosphate synthase
MAAAILEMIKDRDSWKRRAASGLRGVREHYAWASHARRYLELVKPLMERTQPLPRPPRRRRNLYHDRAIFTDLDQNLLGNPSYLPEFTRVIRDHRKCASFGIATGRRLDSALKVIRKYGIPEPDVLITSGGTEIHYAPSLTEDSGWRHHIDYLWTPRKVRRCLEELPGLKFQGKSDQHAFKISYFIDPTKAPSLDEMRSLLHRDELSVNLLLSFGQFLDILPIRASKGYALRYWANHWDVPLNQVLVAGGSGADEDMMRGNTLAVVVANRHHEELLQLNDIEQIYFAQQPFAKGILEAIEHYGFFDACNLPEDA